MADDNYSPPDSGDTEGSPAPTPRGPGEAKPSSDLMGRWTSWLTDPKNRTQLMQTGIDLMQPLSPGQTGLGQLGQAIGGGFEAADAKTREQAELAYRQAEAQRAQEQAQSESELRGAQSEYYKAHAGLLEEGGPAAVAAREKTPEALRLQASRNAAAIETAIQEAQLDAPETVPHLRQLWLKQMEVASGGGAGPSPQHDELIAAAKKHISAGTISLKDALANVQKADKTITEDDLK